MSRWVWLLALIALMIACEPAVSEGQYQCDPSAEDRCPPGYRCLPLGTDFFCLTEETGECGNGILEAGEQCDATLLPGNTCSELGYPGAFPYCIFPVCAIYCSRCGNGIVDPREECDDRNTAVGDGCGPTCLLEVCGNGYLDPGEACDNGPENSDVVPGACRLNCQRPALSVVVENVPQPEALVVDTAAVYWTAPTASFVMKVSVDGGTAEVLAAEQGAPWGIALGSTHVYWTCLNDGAVMRVPKSGGTPSVLASGQERPFCVTVDSTHVYWANAGTGDVLKMPLTGGTPTTLATEQRGPQSLAVDATHLYWRNEQGGEVMSVPVTGGAPTPLALEQYGPASLAVDSAHAYWMQFGALVKQPLAGGALSTLVTTQGELRSLVMDSTDLYWLDWSPSPEEAAVMRVALSGGEPSVVVRQAVPLVLAVGGTHLFWATEGGTILKMTKSPP